MILFTAKNSNMHAATWVCTPSMNTWSTNLRRCINISGETDPFSLQLKLAVHPDWVHPGAGKREERGDGLEGGQRATEP